MEFKQDNFDSKSVKAKYLNRFFQLNSIEELSKNKLFPNIKEITESMSFIYLFEKYLYQWDETLYKNEDVTVIVVGDGKTPRTAALINFLTPFKTISIDPEMDDSKNWSYIKNLTTYKGKFEDWIENVYKPSIYFGKRPVIILYPHSHAPIKLTERINSEKKWVIKLECCTSDKLEGLCVSYQDEYIMSPKNTMYIWNNYMCAKFSNQENFKIGYKTIMGCTSPRKTLEKFGTIKNTPHS